MNNPDCWFKTRQRDITKASKLVSYFLPGTGGAVCNGIIQHLLVRCSLTRAKGAVIGSSPGGGGLKRRTDHVHCSVGKA